MRNIPDFHEFPLADPFGVAIAKSEILAILAMIIRRAVRPVVDIVLVHQRRGVIRVRQQKNPGRPRHHAQVGRIVADLKGGHGSFGLFRGDALARHLGGEIAKTFVAGSARLRPNAVVAQIPQRLPPDFGAVHVHQVNQVGRGDIILGGGAYIAAHALGVFRVEPAQIIIRAGTVGLGVLGNIIPGPRRPPAIFGIMPPVVVGVHHAPQPQLFEVVQAADAPGLVLRPGQRGQQQGRQNGDNGDDDQEFDEGKRTRGAGG